nr:TOBE domain-containing protein [uncultured Undibacterium sp.]
MNSLPGILSEIESEGSVALLDVMVGDQKFSATLLGSNTDFSDWQNGMRVQLSFNEMEVAIAKNLQGQISLRNRLPGVIQQIEAGKILTRVHFLMQQFTISAVITTRSARALQLAVGDHIEGLVKSNEMNVILVNQKAEL